MCELPLRLARALCELPYLPSPERVIDVALKLAKPQEGELFADLGCGDGRVLIRAARKYGVFAVGFELNPLLVKLAKREVRLSGVSHLVEVVRADFFMVDLSKFDIIYAFPSPSVTRRLSLKLISECKRGCRVVVHDYELPLLEPRAEVKLPSQGPHVHRVLLYLI